MATTLRRFLERWFGRREAVEGAGRSMPEGRLRVGDLVVVPASISQARAAQVGGERELALLVEPEAVRSAPSDEPESEYGPHPDIEWTLDLVVPGAEVITTTELDQAFQGGAPSAGRDFTMYGIPEGGTNWTYVHAGGSPTRWRAVAVSIALLDPTKEDGDPLGQEALRSFQSNAAARAATLHGGTISARETAEKAAERAQRYSAVIRDAKLDAVLVLQAPRGGFEGRQAWDALTSLGLEWGDMDLFHWNNRSAVGHDSLFDVWTSTPPGYFLPERIRAGVVHLEDLVFGFQIARSADPHAVLTQMVEGARHVQARLGGALRDGSGQPYDEAAMQEHVQRVVERLAQAGLRPGADTALRLF